MLIAPRIPVATSARVEGSGVVVFNGSMAMVPGKSGDPGNGLYTASKVMFCGIRVRLSWGGVKVRDWADAACASFPPMG